MGKFRIKMRRFRFRRGRKHRHSTREHLMPLVAFIPNLITMLAACCGISSIAFSVSKKWEFALLALFASCICDFMDGCVARALNASSKIGAELDSLADFVDFGVAPGLFMYYWMTSQESFSKIPSEITDTIKPLLLVLALFYAMSCAYRLARFNTMLNEPSDPRWKHYFMGIPAPGGCYILLTPVLLWQGVSGLTPLLVRLGVNDPERYKEIFCSPYLGAAMLFIAGALMVSQMPTLALKYLKLPKSSWLLVLAILIPSFAVLHFWMTIGIVGCLYLFSVPVCAYFFSKTNVAPESENGVPSSDAAATSEDEKNESGVGQ